MNRDELLDVCFGGAALTSGTKIFEMAESRDGAWHVLSHADLAYRRIVVGLSTVTVAAIGNVCTDPAHRGLGYATTQVRRAIVEARAHALIDFACVLSPEDGLFGRLGYRQVDPVRHPELLVLRLTSEPWPPGAIDLRGGW